MSRMFLLSLCLALPIGLHAGESRDAIEVSAEKAGPGVYVLRARGGNIGAVVGEDGVFLVDDQFAPLTEKIRAALKKLPGGQAPVRFVLNTHVHGDHTGGNENFGKAGALIVAHENVRRVMSTAAFRKEFLESASLEHALPAVTFNDRVTFHVNGITLATRHYPHAHTDGDSVVWMREPDIVHMGDVFFASGYPFIDLRLGGSIDGMIDAVADVLAQADEDTVIIPGHGELSDRSDLRDYHAMLVAVRDRVSKAMADGKSLEEIKAMNLSAPYDERWSWSFINGERFVETIFESLSASRHEDH